MDTCVPSYHPPIVLNFIVKMELFYCLDSLEKSVVLDHVKGRGLLYTWLKYPYCRVVPHSDRAFF